jgi:hypothetical protein
MNGANDRQESEATAVQHTLRPDERISRREAIKEALKTLDSTITTIEFLEEPSVPDERGNSWADVWLFRGGLRVPPEEISVLVNIEAKRVLHLKHPSNS